MPTVTSSDTKFVGLLAVMNDELNFLTVNCNVGYIVDWGDGTVTNYAAGDAEHQYNYNDSALNGTLCSRGYKQVIVTITPQVGNTATYLDVTKAHSYGGIYTEYGGDHFRSNWLEMKVSWSSLNYFFPSGARRSMMMEQFSFLSPTNNITAWAQWFNQCYNLQSIPVFYGNTTSTQTESMFAGCRKLKRIPWFQTSGVTQMDYMFAGCYMLEEVPMLDTSSCTNFNAMFSFCVSLKFVPVLNTKEGTNFASMFNACTILEEVPLLNTSKGTNFSLMFNSCFNIRAIPKIDTGLGTNFSHMFTQCYALKSLPVLNTANGTDFSYMLYLCTLLRNVPLLNTANGTDFTGMFQSDHIQTIPLFNTGNGTNFTNMFYGCDSLLEVPLLDLSKATNISGMFSLCTALTYIPTFNTALVQNWDSAFYQTPLLYMPPLNTSAATSMNYTFYQAGRLPSLPAMNVSNVTSFTGAFANLGYCGYIGATGFSQSFDVSSALIGASGLNKLYGGLATVSGKTITVTGNYGTSSDDPSIATAKGWTVVG
jgi:hypothetical protein